MGALNRDIPQLDVRNVFVALRRAWWVLPVCMAIGAGAMFVNESDLQSTPAYATVITSYEARDETLALGVYGINPTAVTEYPSFQTQIRLITEKASVAVEGALGESIPVTISKTSPRVSLINAPLQEDGQQFTVLSIGASNYEFRCDAATAELCNEAIDIYVAETVAQRKASIAEGMTRLADQVAKVDAAAPSATLQTQRAALLSAAEGVTGDITLIGSKVENFGPTMSTVDRSTYVFGAAAGLLVALLIVLQLAIVDRKVRSASRLASRLPHVAMLGELAAANQPSVRHIAAALVAQAKTHGVSSMLLVPASGAAAQELEQLMSGVSGVRIVVGKNIDEMSIDELSATPSACVVVATKDETDMQDVERTQQVLRQAGNNVVGIMLIAAHD
jgi:hypothetical protein